MQYSTFILIISVACTDYKYGKYFTSAITRIADNQMVCRWLETYENA